MIFRNGHSAGVPPFHFPHSFFHSCFLLPSTRRGFFSCPCRGICRKVCARAMWHLVQSFHDTRERPADRVKIRNHAAYPGRPGICRLRLHEGGAVPEIYGGIMFITSPSAKRKVVAWLRGCQPYVQIQTLDRDGGKGDEAGWIQMPAIR